MLAAIPDRRYIALDILHCIINCHSGSYRTTRAVNIKLDILGRIFCFQEEKLRNDQVRTDIVYLFSKENDSVLKKS